MHPGEVDVATARRPLDVRPGHVDAGFATRRRAIQPEFDSDLCGEGRVGEISLSSLSEAAAGAGVCLRGFGLA